MYVRKFESETIDGALKTIKEEFGPDAIILKTVTNNGLKGALKKNRVEVTAAISEKNYTKKSRVDNALDEDTKENFYKNNSSYISEMIDSHSDNRTGEVSSNRYEVKSGGYGNVALNKPVKSTQASGLDDFLNSGSAPQGKPQAMEQLASEKPVAVSAPIEQAAPVPSYEAPVSKVVEKVPEEYLNKISALEKKLFELTRTVERIEENEPIGLFQMRTTLRSLNINEQYIRDISKKAVFELSREDLENTDLVFEFGLREMLTAIPTTMPMFSTIENKNTSVVTILLSDSSCGQTSTSYKLGAMAQNSLIIKYGKEQAEHFAKEILGLEVVTARTLSEIISYIRKGVESGKTIFVDFKDLHADLNETKKFIDGVKRSFAKVEVLICLSSIHSEIYNRKVVNKFQNLAGGLIVTHLDLCLDYGSLFNISYEYSGLPLSFFGTGEVIPEDIEAASGERLLAGMFKF